MIRSTTDARVKKAMTVIRPPHLSYSQVAAEDIALLKQNAPKVYLDCERCDQEYIRTKIPFVNYVRDRKEADVPSCDLITISFKEKMSPTDVID